jgi:hypothetical protein
MMVPPFSFVVGLAALLLALVIAWFAGQLSAIGRAGALSSPFGASLMALVTAGVSLRPLVCC